MTLSNWLLSADSEYARTEVLAAIWSLFRLRPGRGRKFPARSLSDLWTAPRLNPAPKLGWD